MRANKPTLQPQPRGPKPGTRPSGRAKGTPNRNTAELIAALNDRLPGYDTVIDMAEIANRGTMFWKNPLTGEFEERAVSEQTRITCMRSVAEYTHAKRATVSHTGPDGGALEFMVHNDAKAQHALNMLLSTINAVAP